MSFLALLALALGQQPCPHASKVCPHSPPPCCQDAKGCLVKADGDDEIDMGEAEILADPMDDHVIVVEPAKPKHTISLGFAFGKNTPSGVTVVFTKKKEEVAKEERVEAHFYSFGPVVARGEVTIKDASKGCPAAQCEGAKVAGPACDKCPAAKATACDKCPADQCDGSKACDACPACPASGAVAKSATTGGIAQVQAVSFVSASTTEPGKTARRRLIRRR